MKRQTMAIAAFIALGIMFPSSRASLAAAGQIERVGALINVSDLNRSLEFFTRLVGLKEAGRVPIGPGAWEVLLSPGGTDVEGQIALVYRPGAIKSIEQGNGLNRLVFFTKAAADVDRIADKIGSEGYKTIIPPTTSDIPGGRRYRYAHMKGPDDYTVEFTWFDPAIVVPENPEKTR